MLLAYTQAEKARGAGATIMAVGVGDFKFDQLVEIAGGQKHLTFRVSSFLFLCFVSVDSNTCSPENIDITNRPKIY